MTTEHDDRVLDLDDLDGILIDEQLEERVQRAELQLRLRTGTLFTLESDGLAMLLDMPINDEGWVE